jgi:hypothetical protein
MCSKTLAGGRHDFGGPREARHWHQVALIVLRRPSVVESIKRARFEKGGIKIIDDSRVQLNLSWKK